MDTSTKHKIRSEQAGAYGSLKVPATPADKRDYEDGVIRQALDIIHDRLQQPGEYMTSPGLVKDYLRLQLAQEKDEFFCMLLLDTPHRVIAWERVSHGTIDAASVWGRQVVSCALKHNAASVVLVHNHPSGNTEPSTADMTLTSSLADALRVIGVRVLDHMIVGGARSTDRHEFGSISVYSFAENGIMPS